MNFHVLRSPPIKSKIITNMRHYLHSESQERERILRAIGNVSSDQNLRCR